MSALRLNLNGAIRSPLLPAKVSNERDKTRQKWVKKETQREPRGGRNLVEVGYRKWLERVRERLFLLKVLNERGHHA